MQDTVETDQLIKDLRKRIAERTQQPIDSRLEAVETELSKAQEILASGELVLPELLLGDQEWELRTYLRFTSHRPFVGKVLVLLKRILLPPLRWLYEYSQANFVRQKRLNRAMLASLEALALELADLRRQVRELPSTEVRGPSSTVDPDRD